MNSSKFIKLKVLSDFIVLLIEKTISLSFWLAEKLNQNQFKPMAERNGKIFKICVKIAIMAQTINRAFFVSKFKKSLAIVFILGG